ncbi:MAG: hypothetical protein R6U89_01080 [Dehalococcoidia bacterium]
MKTNILHIVSLAVLTVVIGYAFVGSWILGIAAGKFGGGKSEGERGRIRSIIIPLGKWKVHCHHWLVSLGLIGFSSAYGYHLMSAHITYGILGGLAFHGIYSYHDWYKVVALKCGGKKIEPDMGNEDYLIVHESHSEAG